MYLLESIRLKNGKAQLLNYHQNRMQKATLQLWQCGAPDLSLVLSALELPMQGIYKCRLVYEKQSIKHLSIKPYKKRKIKTLQLVEANTVRYHLKYADRSAIDALCIDNKLEEDIIIVQEGYLTDSSYCNIALQAPDDSWHTPDTPLLKGVMRQYLIHEGLIQERRISRDDLSKYRKIRLINAMMPWKDCIELNTKVIQH